MILKLIKLNSVKSTNDEAIKLIRSKKNNQGIVISKKQSNGKGTMGKKWISINGNFFASIFFELKQNMPAPKDFALINPLIIKNILSKYSKFNVKIKWPNDLLIKRKKVCGILQEFIKIDEKSFLIIGIGINTLADDVSLDVAGAVRVQGKKFDTGSEQPSQGTHSKGDIVWNDNPQPGGIVGWVCTNTGTPGEWRSFGNISN